MLLEMWRQGWRIVLDPDPLRSCAVFHKVELVGLVFGHVLLHTGNLPRNNCILRSSPKGVYMLYPSCRVSSFSLESPSRATCSLSQSKWDSSPVSRDPPPRNVLSCLSSNSASAYWDLT